LLLQPNARIGSRVEKIGKQAGQQQDGFAGHGHAGIFEKQRHADGPVAILRDQVAQEIEDGLLLR